MSSLDNSFEAEIKKLMHPPKILLDVVIQKFDSIGIKLSEQQISQFEFQFNNPESCADNPTIQITDEQIAALHPQAEAEIEAKVQDILNKLLPEAEKAVQQILEGIPNAAAQSIQDQVASYLQNLDKSSAKVLRERRAASAAFKQRLANRWGLAFRALDIFIGVSIEIGERYAIEPVNDPENPDYTREALRKLHARASQVSQEVLVLLEHGFADGANARWRCLHEMAVVAEFLKQNNQELAERYLLHEAVEAFRTAKLEAATYSDFYDDPETVAQFENLKEINILLLQRFGDQFGKGYGWAASVINDKHITFEKLEKATNCEPLRPHYKCSSDNVHAGPRGDSYRLGLGNGQHRALLAGPSNAGLEGPGILTAQSFCMITLSILCFEPTMEQLAKGFILKEIRDLVENKFNAAAQQLIRDDLRLSFERRDRMHG